MTGFGVGFGGVGVIGMILSRIAVIAGIVWLVRTMGGSNVQLSMQMHGGTNAHEIFNQRYARDEINRSEYEEMKEDLQ